MNAIRNVFRALVTAAIHPRVWLSFWAAATAVACFAVMPYVEAASTRVGAHPGASFRLDQALDVDLVRLHGEGAIATLPGAILMVLVGAFLSGGVLTSVGVVGVRLRLGAFLADCGRLFFRNFRVLLIGLVVALLVGWGVDVANEWLMEDALYAADPGAAVVPLYFFDVRWAHVVEAIRYLWGFVFLLVVYASKIAMAHLAIGDRHSALLAWFVAAGKLVRRPLRSTGILVLFVVLWLGVPTAIGEAATGILEVRENLVLGFAVGQLALFFVAVVFVALLVSARMFHGQVPHPSTVPIQGVDPRERSAADAGVQ